jgi:hypothetical protein
MPSELPRRKDRLHAYDAERLVMNPGFYTDTRFEGMSNIRMPGTHLLVLVASDHTWGPIHLEINPSPTLPFLPHFADGTMNVTHSNGNPISSKSPMIPLQIPSTYFMDDTIK